MPITIYQNDKLVADIQFSRASKWRIQWADGRTDSAHTLVEAMLKVAQTL